MQSFDAAKFGLERDLLIGLLGTTIANEIVKKLEANPRGLKELELFVIIKDDMFTFVISKGDKTITND